MTTKNDMLHEAVSDVTVIGGGGWGLEILRVLDRIVPFDTTLSLVSRHSAGGVIPTRAIRFQSLDQLPCPKGNSAAIVATAPHDHARYATALLNAGWHVLVEKPLALTYADACAVVAEAERRRRQCWAGLVYLFAPYLAVLKPYAPNARRWTLEWCDPISEFRWGRSKSPPYHVSIIEDVFPHAWSILRAAGLRTPLRLTRVVMDDPSEGVRIELASNGAEIELLLNRHASARRRYLRLDVGQQRVEIDFSREPGKLSIDGIPQSTPLPWNPQQGPLTKQLAAFLDACKGGNMPDQPVTGADSLEAIAILESATTELLEIEARTVATALAAHSVPAGLHRMFYGTLCRDAALSGLRIVEGSTEGKALAEAVDRLLQGDRTVLQVLPRPLAETLQVSPFMRRIELQQSRMSGVQ